MPALTVSSSIVGTTMGRTFSAVPYTYLKRGVYYFVICLILGISSTHHTYACSFNCKEEVKSQPNPKLKLLDFSNADLHVCGQYQATPTTISTQKSVTRYRSPYKEGNFELFMDGLAKQINWYVVQQATDKQNIALLSVMRDNLIQAANANAFTQLDWTGKGAGPQFATSLLIKSISYIYAILDSEKQLNDEDKTVLRSWVAKMLPNRLKKVRPGNKNLDTRFAGDNALIYWGAATKDNAYYQEGKAKFYQRIERWIKSDATFAKSVRHNNEIAHQLIPGAELLALNGENIFERRFKEISVLDFVNTHSEWAFSEGSRKMKTEGDLNDKARAIMRSQGFGTHLAWIPVHLSRFKNSQSVLDLRTKLRSSDVKSFYGKHLSIHTGCIYGNNELKQSLKSGVIKDEWGPLSAESKNDAEINPIDISLPDLKVTKFVLKHGSCGGDDTFDDCTNDRQRIQKRAVEWLPIASAIPKNKEAQNVVYYNFKLLIPSETFFPFFSIGMNQNIADAKLPAYGPPIWKLVTLERTKSLGIKTDQGRSCSFNPELVKRNNWLDFQIMANYSLYSDAENNAWPRAANNKRKGKNPGIDPSFKVWIDGVEVCELFSPLITKRALNEASKPELFVKWGIYNTYVSTFLLSQKQNRDWVAENNLVFKKYQQSSERVGSRSLASSAIANPFDYDWPVKVPTQTLYFSDWEISDEPFY